MNTDCFVSVIIPAYNAEKHIENSLASIVSQKFENFELIVVNDGSKDRTVQKAESILSGSGLKYKIISQENQGVSVARNRGLQEARGKYIFFLDSDDFIGKDCLLKLYNKAETQHADIVFCGFDRVDETGRQIVAYEKEFGYLKKPLTGKEVLVMMLKRKIWIWTGSGFYRRKLLENKLVRYTPGCTHCQDQEFCMKALFHASKVVSVNEMLSHYVQRLNSLMQTASLSELLLESVWLTDTLVKYFELQSADEKLIKYIHIAISNVIVNLFSSSVYDIPPQKLVEMANNRDIKLVLRKLPLVDCSIRNINIWMKGKLLLIWPGFFVSLFRLKGYFIQIFKQKC